MRLAAAGILPSDPCDSGPALEHVRSLGLAGASWHLRALDSLTRVELAEFKARLADAGVALAQLLPPDYESLVDPDPGRRRKGLETLARCGEVATLLGADNLYVRPGSLNPAGAWTPHRENHRPEVRARLVESLRQAARRAEEQGVILAVEGHVISPLDTPEIAREVFDAVASAALRFNLDLVNFVATLDDAFDTEALQARLFDQLAPYIHAAHLKDVAVDERLVVHISETIPGRGNVDFGSLLSRFQNLRPDGWLILEHMEASDLPEAIAAVAAAAQNVKGKT